jgi:hypothetical protein
MVGSVGSLAVGGVGGGQWGLGGGSSGVGNGPGRFWMAKSGGEAGNLAELHREIRSQNFMSIDLPPLSFLGHISFFFSFFLFFFFLNPP